VSIKNLTEDAILYIRSRYSFFAQSKIVLSTSTVNAKVSIETKDGTILWNDECFVDSNDVSAVEGLKNVSLGTAIHYAQWLNARQWCIEAEMPGLVYHPNAYKGVGESLLDPSGIKFLQRF
jgi:hypothetical protein